MKTDTNNAKSATGADSLDRIVRILSRLPKDKWFAIAALGPPGKPFPPIATTQMLVRRGYLERRPVAYMGRMWDYRMTQEGRAFISANAKVEAER